MRVPSLGLMVLSLRRIAGEAKGKRGAFREGRKGKGYFVESQRYRCGGKGAGVYLFGDNGSDGVREMFDETKLFAREEIVYLVVEVMVAESSANVVRKAGRKRAGEGDLDRESDLLGIGALISEEAKTGVEDDLRKV